MKKPPRAYFVAYLKVKGDRDKEREALAGCPGEWKELVRTYINIHKERNNESGKRGQV